MGLQGDIAAAVGAQADQTQAGMAQFSLVLYNYYRSLVDAGFAKPEALGLAKAYQGVIVLAAMNRKGQSG